MIFQYTIKYKFQKGQVQQEKGLVKKYLINGQTKEEVKDLKHIGWGISVGENNNECAENFPKCNKLNGQKNSILAKQ